MTTDKDQEALELAMKIAMRDPRRAEHIKGKLEGSNPNPRGGFFCPPEPWQEVAEFAASLCQRKALDLAPWENPPCHAHIDPMGGDGSVQLLEKMEAAGISRFHPDPLRALEQANAA